MCFGVVSDKMSDDSGVPTKGVDVAVCSPTREGMSVEVMVVVFSPNKKCEMSAVASKHQKNGGGLFSKPKSDGCGFFPYKRNYTKIGSSSVFSNMVFSTTRGVVVLFSPARKRGDSGVSQHKE